MDDFECEAPMYFNFSETNALHENDGADKFFECGIVGDGGTCEGAVDNQSILSEEGAQYMTPETDRTGTPVDENVNKALNQAIKNLCTISKPKKFRQHDDGDGSNKHVRTFCGGQNMFMQNNKKTVNEQKFVSVAEAVRRFQVGTPDRFHSQPKGTLLKRSEKPRRRSFSAKGTIAVTPQLTSHLRSRPVTHLTREEEEEKVLAEMKAHQIKANPLNPKILQPHKPKVVVEKKAPTKQLPFNLTEVKKKVQVPQQSPAYTFSARPVPAKILESVQGVPEKKEVPLTEPASPMCAKRSKKYGTAIDVKDGMKCITQKELHNFGIYTEHIEHKRTTEVKPFSFEERDKQLLKRREELIQKHLEEEKKSREFHAKPVPSNSSNHHKELAFSATQPVPFRLTVDKRGMTKQEQLQKKLEEEERELKEMAQFKARPATVITKKPFQPKKADRPLTDITAVELNTEKRAKEREEFDLKVKMEQAHLEELRRRRDEQQKRAEMEEVARLRKEAVHKALPVPKYKPLEVLSSSRPLTSPKSPAFTHRTRSLLSS
ncbi:hypothetical protein L9F63_024401 [Diploptera punctata]|uniref:Targeting protein for Xklp2 n=1 Tax=Diploptera punctata TaxID=6984 RepID=A0AAD7ZHG3_DIPPU|nr:hypothetical protein L9F63_024401 [Diploptera punctata]